jgi:hypothetical protein
MDCAAGKPPMHVLNEVTGGALESWKAQQREREELKKNDKTARHL